MSRLGTLTLALLALAGCREQRSGEAAPAPVFAELAPLFERECVQCHGATEPAAGYAMTSYLAVTGCTSDGRVAVEPKTQEAPLLAVLLRADHASLLEAREVERLTAWVRAGAPQSRSVIHPVGILDPRSDAWHGKLAATDGWAPLRDAESKLVCGRCHAGSPVTPTEVTLSVPGAPDCTSCHAAEAGVLDCATCHGDGERAYPPRDTCLFEPAAHDAHRAHLAQMRFRTDSLACDTCHAVPAPTALFSGSHANGKVDVRFGSPLAGEDARYDADELSCSVGCHAQAGTQAEPSWDSSEALDCNSCHKSPPDPHYPGDCSTCHKEMGKDEGSLEVGPFHINGKVDLGNGDETCGACHGDSKAGWPKDPGHSAHQGTQLTLAIACTECHTVPDQVLSSGHLNGLREVRFAGRALREGQTPRFDPESRSCSEVACHGTERGGGAVMTPRWGETLAEHGPCGSCHATPPPAPHVQRVGCGGGLCHGDEVAEATGSYRITDSGRARHLDGVVKTGAGP